METKEQERKWHLVRNDNGEWISDENVVFSLRKKQGIFKSCQNWRVNRFQSSMDVMELCGAINMSIIQFKNRQL